MNNYEKILFMLQMQKKLNDKTNGPNWEEGKTKKNKIISWKRCVYMECAELLDSFAWKHWKDISKPADSENIKIELVDIWHFLLSILLENAYKKLSIQEIANNVICVSGFKDFCLESSTLNNHNMYEIINDIENIIHKTSGFEINIYEILTYFFALSIKCGVNLKTLFEIYIAKNILNEFRQNNGYQSGNYMKNWNGKEDNDVLYSIISSGISNTKDIYKKLQEEYNKIQIK